MANEEKKFKVRVSINADALMDVYVYADSAEEAEEILNQDETGALSGEWVEDFLDMAEFSLNVEDDPSEVTE